MADSAQFVIELVDKMSGPLKAQQQALDALDAHLKSAKGGLGDFEAASGGASQGASGFGASLGELNPYIAAATAALAAFVGVAAIAFEGGKLAIEATELKQDTQDALEAFLGSQQAAEDTYSAVRAMGGELSLGIKEGSQMAIQLAAAGIDSKDSLLSSIRAIKSVSLVLGQEAGGKLENILKRTAQTGQFKVQGKQLLGTGIRQADLEQQLSKQLGVVPAVVKKMMAEGKIKAADGISAIEQVINNGKIGELAQKQVLDFGNQINTLKSNFLKLFDGVNTGPFLDGLHSLVLMFDDSTKSGETLKFGITLIMDSMFKLATDAIPYVRMAFVELQIAALEIYIWFKQNESAIKTFGKSLLTGVEVLGLLTAAFFAAEIAAFIFEVVATGGIILAVVALVAAIGWLVDNWDEAWEWVKSAAGAAADWLADEFTALWDTISNFASDAYNAAVDWIDGLIDGIKNGAGAVWDAVKDVASGAWKSFTGFFKMNSPSLLMAEGGMNLMRGLDKGIQANDGGPQASLASAATPTDPPSRMGASQNASDEASKGGDGDVVINIGPGAIVINGASNVEQIREVLPGELAAMFEQMGLSVGAA